MSTSANPGSAPAATPAMRLFISGHSLTDLPFPPYLASVAQSLGFALDWQRQYMVGSSIKDRARGRGAETGWAGYRMGDNRSGAGLDVMAEFKTRPYDVLMITEQHGVVDALVWHDTVRHLRHYHDRFIAGNPKGRTVFYEPWLGIPGRTDVARWVNYERSAAPVWRCVVARVNHSLAAEGRSDRIESLPAGLALAELVERATRGPGLEGISDVSSTATIKKLFTDDVHVTPLAFYYLALVSVGFIAERSPQGASTPEGLGAAQASTLQRLASDFVTRHRREARPPDAESCSKALDSDFLNLYFDHRRDEYWAQLDGNALVKTWKRMKSEAGLRRRLNSHNPLAWVPGAKDTGDWFAPP